MKPLAIADTGNRKTGPVPTYYVGETTEETLESCGKCPMRPQPGKKLRCPAWKGRLRMALGSIQKSNLANPERYTIDNALVNSRRSAKIFRHAVIGNPSGLGVDVVLEIERKVRAMGMHGIGYEHDWWKPKNQPLKDVLLASVGSFAAARTASELGWIASVIVDRKHVGPIVGDGRGFRYRLCVNDMDKSVQCNECGICRPDHPIWTTNQLAGIAFREKGPESLPLEDRL